MGGGKDGGDGGNEPRTYRIAFPAQAGPRPCPVEGCSGRTSTWKVTRVNFWHCHVRETVVILEEGNLPHPECLLCDMLVPCKALNGTHRRTLQCNWGEEWKRWRLSTEGKSEVTIRSFSAYGLPLEMLNSFRYLGWVISAADKNWPVAVMKLSRERAVWRRMARILSREGASPRLPGFFFKAVVQAVLLFGSETWVVTPCMGKALG